MEEEPSVLVCYGERRRVVKLVEPSLDLLQTSALLAYSDVLPANKGGLVFQIQDNNWGGLFIDIEKAQAIPDRNVVRMIMEPAEVVPDSVKSVKQSDDISQVCNCVLLICYSINSVLKDVIMR